MHLDPLRILAIDWMKDLLGARKGKRKKVICAHHSENWICLSLLLPLFWLKSGLLVTSSPCERSYLFYHSCFGISLPVDLISFFFALLLALFLDRSHSLRPCRFGSMFRDLRCSLLLDDQFF